MLAAALPSGCAREEPLALPGPFAAPTAAPEDDVVAVVGGSPVTALQYKQALVRQGVHLLGGARASAAQEQVIEELIRQRLLAVAGRAAGYEKDPDIEDTLERMLAERYLRDLVRANKAAAPVTAEEVRAYYDAHRDQFAAPERFRGAVILIAYPPRAAAAERGEARRRAEEIARQAAAADDPEAFARLAREHSGDVRTRARGGDLGWLPKGGETFEADGAVLAALFQMESVGAIALPVETPKGVAIVRLTGREEGGVRPFEEVAGDIARRLTARRTAELHEQRYRQLRDRFEVQVNAALLAQVRTALAGRADEPRPPAFPVGDPGPGTGASEDGATDREG